MSSIGSYGGASPSGGNSAAGGALGKGVNRDIIEQITREEFGRKGVTEEQALAATIERLGLKGKKMVFYGFQGPLAGQFSLVEESNEQEIKLRCMALSNAVSPVFHDVLTFSTFYDQYNKPEGTLKSIAFEDAMQSLRLAEKLAPKEEFVDAEVDEFDDDCTEDCIPGNHTCGK